MKLYDYECVTTFWQDFSIAERFGSEAIHETYNRAVIDWSHDITYMTELVMVLNHKMWYYAESNEALSLLYQELWEKTDAEMFNLFSGDDIQYYLRTVD